MVILPLPPLPPLSPPLPLLPSLSGDYCHMAYNVITALCLLKLLERSQRPVAPYVQVGE